MRPFRTATAPVATCLLAVFITLTSLESVAADEDSAQISKWIEQLDDDSFITRELATEQLLTRGRPAIAPLADKLPNSNLEMVSRGTYILRELAMSTAPELSEEAERGLKKVAESNDPQAARQASATLNRLGEIRRERALSELQRLGAVIDTQHVQIGQAIIPNLRTLELAEQWQGKPEDLRHLRWLLDVQHVALQGENINDQCITHLRHLENLSIVRLKRAKITNRALEHLAVHKNLQHLAILYCPVSDQSIDHLKVHQKVSHLKLYGTEMTAAGAERLQKEMNNTNVDYRQGAFLGIACDPAAAECIITYLQPGGAAEKGGLQEGDLILSYNGKRAGSFDKLTKLIAENGPGDKAKIELMRDGETLTKEIELGEWE